MIAMAVPRDADGVPDQARILDFMRP